jgi:F-type H+-transporting ATPase subunit delta
MSLLTQRYAKAIFEVAEKAGAVDAVAGDLSRLSTTLSDPALGGPILSPDTKADARERILHSILGDAHDLTKNLVGVVLGRRREAVLPDLASEFLAMQRAARGEVLGILETAKPVDELAVREMEGRAAPLAGKKVTFEVKVDEELIGGVRIRIGNTLYDGSVATAIEDLHRRLMDAPI